MSAGVVRVSALGDVRLPGTLLSSGAIIAAIDDVKQHATHLNNDIIANGPAITAADGGVRFKGDWQSFVTRFDAWNARQRGAGGVIRYVAGQMVAELRQFAAEYNELEQTYTSVTGLLPSYNPQPPSNQILPTEVWVGIGVASFVAVLGFGAWGLSSYAKVAAPVARARAATINGLGVWR